MELRPALKKSLGQHLLKDKNLLRKMVRLAGVGREDTVIEIGPGHGDLTRCIAEAARSVVAIELDERFREILEPVESDFPTYASSFPIYSTWICGPLRRVGLHGNGKYSLQHNG